MNQPAKRRLLLAAGLAALALFLGWEWFALKAYVRQDAAPPSWDQSDHLSDAWDYRQALERGRWSVLWTLPPKPGMPPFPPLYALSIMGSYSSPKPAQAALLINWFYLALLCLSVFGIAWEFRPDLTALAAAIIFAGAPAVQDLLFTQLMDLAVVAFAAAAYWALIRSGKFKRWPGSLAFGALFAAGMLYKWSFFSYLLPAFWVAGGALRDPERQPKVLTSAGFALAGFAPWYFAEAPLLLPKLIQASADQSVAFWRGGAVLAYFKDSINGLGLPFFLLGWLSLLSPRHKRRWESMRLLPAWIAASYLFWTVVPNRQMRFLLPGLPALAVCAASAWPDLIVWPLAGFQLLSAANFPAGVIPATSVPMPLDATATLLPSRPPSPADWKIADILKTADELRDPQEPFANATLVANAPQFNGPTFAWEDQRLGLSHVKMRAVNHRLCELSQFVILKTGSLGPPAVIAGLPEAAAQIQDPHGWFRRAFVQAGAWPLPDGSQALLFRQRRFRRPPFRARVFHFQFYRSGPLAAKNMRIDLGRWDARAGDYPRVRVSAPQVLFRGLAVTNFALELNDVLLVPVKDEPGRQAWDDVRFLRIGRLKIVSARLSADDLRLFLENRAKKLNLSSLSMENEVLSLQGRFSAIPVSASARIALNHAPPRLDFSVLSASAAGLPLPVGWLGRMVPLSLSLAPNPEVPFAIDAGSVAMAGGSLRVGGG